jgi:hypothetical protein
MDDRWTISIFDEDARNFDGDWIAAVGVAAADGRMLKGHVSYGNNPTCVLDIVRNDFRMSDRAAQLGLQLVFSGFYSGVEEGCIVETVPLCCLLFRLRTEFSRVSPPHRRRW